MNKDASDFMLEEYTQIASAYFGLRDQINEWFKSYITLIGLPYDFGSSYKTCRRVTRKYFNF